MKKNLYILFSLLWITACQVRFNDKTVLPNYSTAQNIIKNVEKALLPDKRDHIFDVTLQEKDGKIELLGTTDYPKMLQAITDSLQTKKISFINKVQILPLPELKNQIGVTRLSVANLRAQPKHSAELVTQTLMGMPLKIFNQENGFYQVQTPEGYYAWIDAAGIKIMPKTDYQTWQKQAKVIVTSLYTTVYSKSNTSSLPVSDAVINDIFIKSGSENDFVKVTYPDRRTGYIPLGDVIDMEVFLSANRRYLTQNDIVTFAKQYLGIPYLWGGTSSKALDCSGFTKTVYAQAGYLLPRDASQQAKIGKKLKLNKQDFSNLQPGDLLFFGRIKDGKPKITHVAIHIDNGQIIHATGEVKIESLNPNDKNYNDDRLKSLLMARRVYGEYPQVFGVYK